LYDDIFKEKWGHLQGELTLALRGHSLRGLFLMHAANNLVARIADEFDLWWGRPKKQDAMAL
jgi:hypothetical protein